MTVSDEKLAEIAPCPFCGCSDIVSSNVGEDEDNWFVGCMESDCGVNPGVFCPDSEADAIALWNRRAERVKPLDWEQSKMLEGEQWHSTGPFLYTIRRQVLSEWGEYRWSLATGFGYAETLEEAKAAAQADYTRRILSTLTPIPAEASLTTARTDGIEALKLIADIAEGSTTANSLPHIAKLARAALDNSWQRYSDAAQLADLKRSVMQCATLEDLHSVQITLQRINEADEPWDVEISHN